MGLGCWRFGLFYRNRRGVDPLCLNCLLHVLLRAGLHVVSKSERRRGRSSHERGKGKDMMDKHVPHCVP